MDVRRLFPSLNRSEEAREAAVHQALISDVIRCLEQRAVPVGHLFADQRRRLVRSSAPRRSWLTVLAKNGFPCRMEDEGPSRIDPVLDLIEIGQFADADREQLLKLALWLAPNMRSCRKDDTEMVDRGPLAWAPVRLETENVEFDTCCLGTTVETHGMWKVIHKDSLTQIEREGRLMGIINQCRYRLLEAKCVIRQILIEYLCDYIPEGIAYVEKHEGKRGFGSLSVVKSHFNRPCSFVLEQLLSKSEKRFVRTHWLQEVLGLSEACE